MDVLGCVKEAIRKAAPYQLPPELAESHSFVLDLGFDSLAMARLGLTLEEQFGFALLLDPWLSSQSDPAALTVGSLRAFVEARIHADERAAS
jgi:acyl carrier protein